MLQEKYAAIVIPPLPSKQYNGRFEAAFIEQRQLGLLYFLNKVAWHPVLRASPAFLHFMECADQKAWKEGKRRTEKDTVKGAVFFKTINHDGRLPADADQQIDGFKKTVAQLTRRCGMMAASNVAVMARGQALANDYKKFGAAARHLGAVEDGFKCWRSNCEVCEQFCAAWKSMGDCADTVAELHKKNSESNFRHLQFLLGQYQEQIVEYQDMVKTRDAALGTYISSQGKAKGGDSKVLEDMKARVDVVTSMTLAEINNFHLQRLAEFKQAALDFVDAQIEHNSKILAAWQQTRAQFDAVVSEPANTPLIK
eukprot:TRINITY_DN2878_c0_g1_i1.p1 TRINITY_DN2878_c0_g1~~TRINITY_DN2878_c0_g1_i1.p1  ORF type:complete len:311 (+),score=98.00 TRINITY_DN2878_c0_g1_i1:817-1749(+)